MSEAMSGWPLELRREAGGGERYFVGGRPLHCGNSLRIWMKGLTGEALWLPCSYEMEYRVGRDGVARFLPAFYVALQRPTIFELRGDDNAGYIIWDRRFRRRVDAELREADESRPYRDVEGGPVWADREAARDMLNCLEWLQNSLSAKLLLEDDTLHLARLCWPGDLGSR